jgi:hypothetical protein
MHRIGLRLEKLEKSLATVDGPRRTLRVVVQAVCGPTTLANSECTRTLSADGMLVEYVHLDGSSKELPDGELERFIASFPIAEMERVR